MIRVPTGKFREYENTTPPPDGKHTIFGPAEHVIRDQEQHDPGSVLYLKDGETTFTTYGKSYTPAEGRRKDQQQLSPTTRTTAYTVQQSIKPRMTYTTQDGVAMTYHFVFKLDPLVPDHLLKDHKYFLPHIEITGPQGEDLGTLPIPDLYPQLRVPKQ